MKKNEELDAKYSEVIDMVTANGAEELLINYLKADEKTRNMVMQIIQQNMPHDQ